MTTMPQSAIGGPSNEFHRDYRSLRTLFSIALSVLAGVLTVIACVPLFSVLIMLILRGGSRLIQGGIAIFASVPPGPLDKGGGFGNALVGTAFMVGIALLIAIPFGILAAIFLSEYAGKSHFAVSVRFAAKILTGLPSILAGVFAYAVLVTVTGYSALAGGIALSVLIIPVVLLTAEEAIKMVPQKMREAAVGMGCTQAQVVWKIVVPTALPGILTGVMLAVARAAGETAPLLFTAQYASTMWPIDGRAPFVHTWQPTASMAVFIYNSSGTAYDNLIALAWAASFVLVITVLVLNIGGQLLSSRSRPQR